MKPISTLTRQLLKVSLWIIGVFLAIAALHYFDYRHVRAAQERLTAAVNAHDSAYLDKLGLDTESSERDACTADIGKEAYRACIHKLTSSVESYPLAYLMAWKARDWLHHYGSNEDLEQDFKAAIQRGRDSLEADKAVLRAIDNFNQELSKTWTFRMMVGPPLHPVNTYDRWVQTFKRLEAGELDSLYYSNE